MSDKTSQQPSPRPPPPTRNLRLVQVMTVVIIIAAVAGTVWLRENEVLVRRIAQSPFALPALFVVSVVSSATLFLPVPGLAITTLVGSIISPLAVGIVAGVGQTLGEMSGYMAGYSGQGLVNRAQFYERIEGWMRRKEKMSELVIFVLALIPNPFFDAAGMAAGVLRFPIWKYLVAAGLGKVIKNILFAYGGALSLDWISRLFG